MSALRRPLFNSDPLLTPPTAWRIIVAMLLRKTGSAPAILLLLLGVVATAQVREKATPATREQEVRDLLEKYNLAYQQKDVEAISKLVATDLTAFAAGKVFKSWEEYRDNFLHAALARTMPASTWGIEKVVTSPEMAWAYTRTEYQVKRQGQQIEADLYQVFIVQKPGEAGKSKTRSAMPEWKIEVIDSTFHAAGPNQQSDGAQPRK